MVFYLMLNWVAAAARGCRHVSSSNINHFNNSECCSIKGYVAIYSSHYNILG